MMMTTSKYLKDKRSGLVIDTSADFGKYLQEKAKIKELVATKKDLDHTKQELSVVKNELGEIKDLLKQLLKAKNESNNNAS